MDGAERQNTRVKIALEGERRERRHPGGIILIGFDASPDEVKAIAAGDETGSVAQFPAKIGSIGISTLYQAVQGKKVPKNVDTGTALVTSANASKFG